MFEHSARTAFCIVLTLPNPALPDFEMSEAWLQRFLNNGESMKHVDRQLFFEGIVHACEGRSRFTTGQGYNGLAPIETKVKDLICVLLGCQPLMVLRPTEEGTFALVGECYCDGIMDGAPLLGAPPNGFEFAWNNEGSGEPVAAYIDRQSGMLHIEDPRLVGTALLPSSHIEPPGNKETNLVSI
jgi:hypothetical protein